MIGHRGNGIGTVPSVAEAVLANVQVLQMTIIAEKRRHSPPDIYIDCFLSVIEALEFHRAETVFKQAAPSKTKLWQQLTDWLEDNDWAVTGGGLNSRATADLRPGRR